MQLPEHTMQSIHMIDLRTQEILIEIELDKLFVVKYVVNDWIQFNTIMNAKNGPRETHR